jgi:hypothetical protein
MLKNLIFLFGFSTFVTIVWIVTTLYHNSVTSQISKANQVRIEPINPSFDMETLESLDGRQIITVNLSNNLSIIGNPEDGSTATESSNIETQLIDTQDISQ